MSKASKIGMIIQILLSPIRILGKAPKLYAKGMVGCAGRFGYSTEAAAYNLSDLPRSYTISSCKASEKEGEYESLLLALDRKRREMSLDLSRGNPTRGLSGVGIRSYSVGIGKIGRIDEERPCSFREVDVAKADVYPRCRSNALLLYK